MSRRAAPEPWRARKRLGRWTRTRVLVAGLAASGIIAAGSGLAYAATAGGTAGQERPGHANRLGAVPSCLIFPSCRGIPAAKASILRRQARALAAARRHPAPKTTPAPQTPAQSPQPPRAEGLEHAHQSPFPYAEFAVSDSWQGPAGGRWVVAYAGTWYTGDWGGGFFDTPHTGAVALFDEPVNPNAPEYFHLAGVFHAPAGDLGLTIVSYRGDTLALKTQSGAIIYFNVASHHFS
jgi:hypothetical protein